MCFTLESVWRKQTKIHCQLLNSVNDLIDTLLCTHLQRKVPILQISGYKFYRFFFIRSF